MNHEIKMTLVKYSTEVIEPITCQVSHGPNLMDHKT